MVELQGTELRHLIKSGETITVELTANTFCQQWKNVEFARHFLGV